MFYANPQASWRYILGHEQTLMPVEDQKILHDIQLSGRSVESHSPWIKKMTLDDRLVFCDYVYDIPKKFPELEWKQIYPSKWWIGRKTRIIPEPNTN